jgi:prepilin-type N-terminal cleavage/methylation domain-containing protein
LESHVKAMCMTTLWMHRKLPAGWWRRSLQPRLEASFRPDATRLPCRPRHRSRRQAVIQAGFSLVELLVVAGILTIAMAAVMGTLSLALQTNRNNSALVEANNNVRAVINFIKNDLDNVGELPLTSVFSDTNPNPRLRASAVYVRGGFLEARGFPVGSGSQAPDQIGNVHPLLNDGTLNNTRCDILSPIQAWTTVSHGALSQGTFASPALVANQGYADTEGTPAAERYPNLRLYPGACDPTEVATAYGNGSHQLITLQVNPVPVALRVSVPDPANPGNNIVQQQIFPVEATFSAYAQLDGGNLVLVPERTTSSDPDYGGSILAGTPVNLKPNRVAPNVVTNSNPFVNPNDRLLAPRLRPYVDTLLLTYRYTPPGGDGSPLPTSTLNNSSAPTTLCVLGLVTGIQGNNIVLAGNDLAGINPEWSVIIQNNVPVTITRMRLSHYFVGWDGGDSAPVLYCRQGGLLSPLAFDIENLRLNFTLVDEGAVRADGTPIQGFMFNTNDIGGPIPLPSGADPTRNPARTPLTTKTQVRLVELTVYGRTGERERALIRADAAIPDAFNRGYFHVSERTTIGLRNLVPQ